MIHIPVKMILKKEDMNILHEFVKKYEVPEGYRIRNFKEGEGPVWAQTETGAGEFKTEEDALDHFYKEFGKYLDKMEELCFFIEDMHHLRPVGTAMAWFMAEEGKTDTGRLHWVGIHRDHQGRKLAKPLLARVGRALFENYESAYLTTQTTSYKAINIYLEMGFSPVVEGSRSEKAWTVIEDILKKKILYGG